MQTLPRTSMESCLPSIQNAQVLLHLHGLNVISRSGSGKWIYSPNLDSWWQAAPPSYFSNPDSLSLYHSHYHYTVSAFKGDESIGATDRNTHTEIYKPTPPISLCSMILLAPSLSCGLRTSIGKTCPKTCSKVLRSSWEATWSHGPSVKIGEKQVCLRGWFPPSFL